MYGWDMAGLVCLNCQERNNYSSCLLCHAAGCCAPLLAQRTARECEELNVRQSRDILLSYHGVVMSAEKLILKYVIHNCKYKTIFSRTTVRFHWRKDWDSFTRPHCYAWTSCMVEENFFEELEWRALVD